MRRDPELIRTILLAIEADDSAGAGVTLAIPDVSTSQVGYHVKLLTQAGFVEAQDVTTREDGVEWLASSLTWQGHEFLDAARDKKIWRKALSKTGKAASSVSFAILVEVLNQLAKAALKLP
jgi:hypothetical protein